MGEMPPTGTVAPKAVWRCTLSLWLYYAGNNKWLNASLFLPIDLAQFWLQAPVSLTVPWSYELLLSFHNYYCFPACVLPFSSALLYISVLPFSPVLLLTYISLPFISKSFWGSSLPRTFLFLLSFLSMYFLGCHCCSFFYKFCSLENKVKNT